MYRSNRAWIAGVVVLLCAGSTSSQALAQTDLSGEWRMVKHEDQNIDIGSPEIGDYVGVPLNRALLLTAQSWDAAVMTLPEHQCLPQGLQVSMRGLSGQQLRIWKDVDPSSLQVIAFQMLGFWMEPRRTIWMDGRPHPSEYAAHTWQGFSTGKWEGNQLTVTTTHLKESYIHMNGLASSDQAVMTEHFIRHENYLTDVMILDDPVYLTEPLIKTETWVLDSRLVFSRYPCGANEIVIEIVRPKGVVPHHLPGTNKWLGEIAALYGLPVEAMMSGAEGMYPEYVEKLKTTMKPATAKTGAAK